MATKVNFLQYTCRFRINHKTLYSQIYPGPQCGSWTILDNGIGTVKCKVHYNKRLHPPVCYH